MAAVLRFVDGISTTPTVLLDLNDVTNYRLAEGWSFAPPELQRASSSSLLVDGDTVSASVYSNREIRLPLLLSSTTAAGRATLLSKLVKQIDKPTGWLEWRPDGIASSVFFRVLRSGQTYDRLDLRQGDGQVTLNLSAEPFGYGQREMLGPWVVSSDPVNLVNGLSVDLTGTAIKGDVKTPLYLWTTTELTNTSANTVLIGTKTTPFTESVVFEFPFEGNAGLDTTPSGAADPIYSSGDYFRTTFASNNTLTTPRIQVARLEAPKGKHRLLLAVRKGNAGDTFALRASVSSYAHATPAAPMQTFTWGATTGLGVYILDLGLFQSPVGGNTDSNGLAPGADAGGIDISIYAQRLSGSSHLDFDFLYMLPVQGTYMASQMSQGGTATVNAWAWDSINETFRRLTGANAAADPFTNVIEVGGSPTSTAGAWPVLAPGNVNTLLLWPRANINGSGSSAQNTATFRAAYWPRYIFVPS